MGGGGMKILLLPLALSSAQVSTPLKTKDLVNHLDSGLSSKSAGKTVAITILIINIGNSNNLNKF